MANFFEQLEQRQGGNFFEQLEQSAQINGGVDPTEGMSAWERFKVGMGRGFTDVGQGVQQIFRGDEYDQRVREEADRFQREMGDSGLATAGRVTGNIAATAVPGGAAAKGAQALKLGGSAARGFAAPAIQGAAAGATESAMLGNYGDATKLEQVLGGAALGSAGGVAAEGALRALSGLVNAPRRGAEALMKPREGVAGRILGRAEDAAEGRRVAEATGIDLSPAEMSGGKAAMMAENIASDSIWARDEAFDIANTKARQMVNYVRKIGDRISKNPDSVATARSIQGEVDRMARDLAADRSRFGREAYGKIDQAAGGAPVVETTNTRSAIQSIMEEFDGTVGGDGEQIFSQAKRFLENFEKGPISAQKALRQMQAWGQAARGGGRVFSEVTPGQDRRLARMLSEAIMADLDDVAAKGGTLGEMVREANAGWRARTQGIEALDQSLLGRVVGEEMADELGGVAFNKIAPEKVFAKLRTAEPSELQVARKYIEERNPNLWRQFQASILEESLQEAQTFAPSAGARTLEINPGAFVKALTGNAGKQGVKAERRLEAIFGGTDEYKMLRDVLDAGERMADTTGKNFSGTAAASEATGLLNTVTGGLRALGKGGVNALGARAVVQNMAPGAAAKVPYYAAPRNITVNPLTGTSAPIAGLSGFLAAYGLNQPR